VGYPLSTTETGLLLLIQRLDRTGRPLGRETIVPFAEIKLPDVASDYDRLVRALEEQALIEGDAEAFMLTSKGQDAVDRISRGHSLHAMFYDAYYEALLHSDAHALFLRARLWEKPGPARRGGHGAAPHPA
jgi:hypothetical protein